MVLKVLFILDWAKWKPWNRNLEVGGKATSMAVLWYKHLEAWPEACQEISSVGCRGDLIFGGMCFWSWRTWIWHPTPMLRKNKTKRVWLCILRVCFCCLLAYSQPPGSERNHQRSKVEVTKQDTDVLLSSSHTWYPKPHTHSPQLWGCLCCILKEEEKVARERTARSVSGREACVWKDC